MNASTRQSAFRLATLLARDARQLVLAESCTGGLVSAALAGIPGISGYLCGSAVTYQTATKQEWLAVAPSILQRPGPVSRIVAERMACSNLQRTPHANLSAAVTGHLGPHAPKKLDGLVFIAIAERQGPEIVLPVQTRRLLLRTKSRGARQEEATRAVLDFLHEWLASSTPLDGA